MHMKVVQKCITLKPYPRGYHLITALIEEQLGEIRDINAGILHVFIKHTSAALCINENADPSVRKDFASFIDDLIPEDYPKFIHTYEGEDDMPAHLKSSLIGCSIQVPITKGRLNLGTWQGIYLCEFRNFGGARKLVLTAYGQ